MIINNQTIIIKIQNPVYELINLLMIGVYFVITLYHNDSFYIYKRDEYDGITIGTLLKIDRVHLKLP